MTINKLKIPTSSVAIDYDVTTIGDEYKPLRLSIIFDSAPTTAESITVTIEDATHNELILSQDPVGSTIVSWTDLPPIKNGDVLNIAYANTDTRAITGVLTYEV